MRSASRRARRRPTAPPSGNSTRRSTGENYVVGAPSPLITVLRLLRLTAPSDFADWYAASRAYTRRVAAEMGFEGVDALDDDAVVDRLRSDPRSLSSAGARSVATTLLADGAFSEPYCEWMPLWYELVLVLPVRYGEWRLRRVAREVAAGAGVSVVAPRFSRPQDVTVDGAPALETVSGFRDRFLLAAALLHLEWFVHAARADGIRVPDAFVDRARRETLTAYADEKSRVPDRTALSPEIRRFQRLLFTDDAWVRDVDEAYGLDSRLFGLWERLLRAERQRLADGE